MLGNKWGVALRLLASTLAVTYPAPGSAAATDGQDLGAVRQLLESQQDDDAYARLQPWIAEAAGDPAFDYLLGVAALRTGRAVEAILAFERLVDADPANAEARAYLARALFEAGENASARTEFQRVLDTDSALPPPVSNEIAQYLSAIENRLDRDATRWALYFETGAGFDSNVNSATDARAVAVPALGGIQVDLTSGSRERSSTLWNVAGGGGFALRLAEDWTVLGSGGLRHRLTVQEADFRQFIARADLGVEWAVDGTDTLRLVAGGERFDVGGDGNREVGGLTLQWQHSLAQRTQVTGFVQGGAQRFPNQAFRNVDRYVAGAGYVHRFLSRGDPLLVASGYGGIEDATRTGAERVSRTLVGTRLGGEVTLDPRLTAFSWLDYQYSDYAGAEPLFARARREHFVAVTFGARYRIQGGWSVMPQLAWSRNEANLELFRYDRWEALVTLRNDF